MAHIKVSVLAVLEDEFNKFSHLLGGVEVADRFGNLLLGTIDHTFDMPDAPDGAVWMNPGWGHREGAIYLRGIQWLDAELQPIGNTRFR